jgi:LAS superfamily LD-carboxypeptidase LdcB
MKAPAFQLTAGDDAPIQRQQAPQQQQQDAAAPIQRYTQNELTGQFDPTAHPDFVKVEVQGEREHYLRRETAVAWNQMQAAASAAGHRIWLVSSTRNFADQRRIWNAKWNREPFNQIADPAARSRAIMDYSSMPGTSRHHWGTDLDMNSVEPGDWADRNGATQAGQYNGLYQWLRAHAASYGFAQTYTQRGSGPGQRTGYNEERWHWSYVPTAATMHTEYSNTITNQTVAGLPFNGAGSAPGVRAVEDYVNGVDPAARGGAARRARPRVLGTVTPTSFPLNIRQDPDRNATSLMQVTTARTFNYYQEQTDAAGNIWVLVEEGWFARRFGGRDLATVAPARR